MFMKGIAQKMPVIVGVILVGIFALIFTACPPEDQSHTHQWGDWTVTTPATCTEQGVERRICTLDPTHTETRVVIPALGHDYQFTITVAPTCTEDGYDLYTCSKCSDTEKRNIIEALAKAYFGIWKYSGQYVEAIFNINASSVVLKTTGGNGFINSAPTWEESAQTSVNTGLEFNSFTVDDDYNSSGYKISGTFLPYEGIWEYDNLPMYIFLHKTDLSKVLIRTAYTTWEFLME